MLSKHVSNIKLDYKEKVVKITWEVNSWEESQSDHENKRTKKVELHSSFSRIEGVFESHDEVMTQAKVESQRHQLEEVDKVLIWLAQI